MQGWISLHRQIQESAIYKDSQAVHLWVHLLLKANHKDKEVIFNGEPITIKAGQLLTGRKKLSAETGISESKIQRLLKLFQKCHMIEQQTNSKNRLISITKYHSYQQGEQQTNNKRTTTEQQLNTNNNVNNVNNVNNIIKSENKFSDDDMECAVYIESKIEFTTKQKPNLNKWADTIRLMRERDGLTHRQICEVFRWANHDPFWSANIRSPDKLRKQFETLVAQMNRPAKQSGQIELGS